jgi:WD40 repeat protein/uncharacterized caspase-like protein
MSSKRTIHKTAVHDEMKGKCRSLTRVPILMMIAFVNLITCSNLGWSTIRQASPTFMVLPPQAHSGPITAIVSMPQRDAVATASNDGTIRIWSKMTGVLLGLPQDDYRHQVTSIAVRPDNEGELAASFSTPYITDSYVGIVDVASGSIHRFSTERVAELSFSPDGKTLAGTTPPVGSTPGRVLLWNVNTGRELRILDSTGGKAQFLDDHTIAVQQKDFLVFVDFESGHPDVRLPTGPGVTFIANLPLGLVFHLNKDVVSIWSISERKLVNSVQLFSQAQMLAFDPDTRVLFAAGFQSGGIGGVPQNRLYKISGTNWTNLEGIDGPDDRITALSAFGGSLMVGEINGKILRYKLTGDLEVQADFGIRSEDVSSIAISSDIRLLAAGDHGGLVHVWEVDSGAYRRTDPFNWSRGYDPYFPSDSKLRGVTEIFTVGSPPKAAFVSVLKMAFIGDSTKLAICYGNGNVIVEDVVSQKVYVQDKIVTAGLTDFLTIGNDTVLIGSGGKLHFWTALEGGESRVEDTDMNNFESLGITPDHQNIVLASRNKIEVVSASRPSSVLHSFQPQVGGEYKVLVIDNETVALLSETQVMMWKFASSELEVSSITEEIPPKLLPDMQAISVSQVLTADRSAVMAGGYGIHVWKLEHPRILRYIDPGFSVTAIGATNDGRRIVVGGRNGRIDIIDASSGRSLGAIDILSSAGWYAHASGGFFDGSPTLWDRLSFVPSTKQLTIFSSQQVFRELYTPNLISQFMMRSAPLHVSTLTSLRKIVETLPPQVGPPRVEILEPAPTVTIGHGKLQHAEWVMTSASGQPMRTIPSIKPQPEGSLIESRPRLTETTVTVSLDVKDGGGGITICKLFRNRQLVHLFHKPISGRLSAEVEVLAGTVEFSAYCFDRYGVRSAIARTTVVGDEKLRHLGKAYILAIGVDGYPNFGHSLQYAGKDADLLSTVLYEELSKSSSFKEIVPPVELIDEEATVGNILVALQQLSDEHETATKHPPQLSRLSPTSPDDAVFLYFSGHGGKVGSQYLLLANEFEINAKTKKWSGAITDIQLAAELSKLKASKIVVILDSCESGSALGSGQSSVGPYNFRSFAQMAYDKGMFVIAATQSRQSAHELPELGHGLFTFILMEDGLRHHLADWRPADGKITAREWLQYSAEHRVPLSQSIIGQPTQAVPRRLSPDADPTGHATSLWEQTPRLFLPDIYNDFDFVISNPH